jgi:phosphate transport system substrate-binding protein
MDLCGATRRQQHNEEDTPKMITAFPKQALALAMVTAIAVAACGGGSATPAQSGAPGSAEPGASAPSGISGSITVSGSSTVEPISTGVAELLKESNPDFNYTIEGPGTGDGFKRFCAGETDISDASRTIKDAEAEACKAAGIEYVELKVAFDGMTVMTNPANRAITCLSFADLYALIGPESTGFDTWAKAAPLAAELGSNTSLPDAPLSITGPGEESGTFDSFVELAIKPIAESREVTPVTTRPDYTASANDNAIIEGVAGSDTALGWVGFAFAEENADKIKELEVSKDPNGTCVAPTADTIADGSYPLSRSLYIYVNKARAAANPAVVGYIDYYLAEGTIAKVLEVVPYVSLPTAELDATRAAWEGSR